MNENIDSESLKRVIFKTNPKPFHVDVNMKHLHIARPLVGLFVLVELVLTAEHKIQGARLDPDPLPYIYLNLPVSTPWSLNPPISTP